MTVISVAASPEDEEVVVVVGRALPCFGESWHALAPRIGSWVPIRSLLGLPKVEPNGGYEWRASIPAGDRPMTDRPELSDLPETYALALRLRAEGLDDAAIARVLEIEAESVAPMLALARSKLADFAGRREGEDGSTEANQEGD